MREQNGMVLLLVLLVLTLLAALAMELGYANLLELRMAKGFRDRQQAFELARGGIEAGRWLLQTDGNSYDTRNEQWAQGIPSYPLAGGQLQVKISELDSRINLNALVDSHGNVNAVIYDRLERLFLKLELSRPQEILAALADWLDPDNETRPLGAESPYYRSQEPGYSCTNGPLGGLAELTRVAGFNRDNLQQLRPYITLFGDEQANINLAAATLLEIYTQGPPETMGDVQFIQERQRQQPFQSTEELNDLTTLSGFEHMFLDPWKVSSAIYRIDSYGRIDDTQLHLVAIYDKSTGTIRRLYQAP